MIIFFDKNENNIMTKFINIKKKVYSSLTIIKTKNNCNILSQFSINDGHFIKFNRILIHNNDCVINALQLIGIFDSVRSNIIRVLCSNIIGFSIDQIEKVFVIASNYKHKYKFKYTSCYNEYISTIIQYLQVGNVVFSGYSGHVYLIGKTIDGTIIYIDPQTGEITDKFNIYAENRIYYLMFNS